MQNIWDFMGFLKSNRMKEQPMVKKILKGMKEKLENVRQPKVTYKQSILKSYGIYRLKSLWVRDHFIILDDSMTKSLQNQENAQQNSVEH